MPDDILAKLKASYASFTLGKAKGKNHGKVMLLKGDPTWTLATAPLATLIDLVWASLAGVPGLPSLSTIIDWWTTTTTTPKRWNGIRGPVGATRRIMRQLGWTAKDDRPLVLMTRDGTEMNILTMGPKLVKAQIKADWHNIIAENLATKHGLPQHHRLDYEHARKHLELNDNLTDREKATAANYIVGGTWDVPRLLKAGYAVQEEDRLCQLCGKELDTLHHRLFECRNPDVCEHRDEHLTGRVRGWLLGSKSVFDYRPPAGLCDREHQARDLALQGLARDPSVGQPQPAIEGYEYVGTDFADILPNVSGQLIFPDGTCTRPFHTRLARAAWSFTLCDAEGGELAKAYGPVWRGLPQSAPCAETVAAAAIADVVGASSLGHRVVGDNLAVVNLITNPTPLPALHRLWFAGVWRSMYMRNGWNNIQGNAEHVRSHQVDDMDADLSHLEPAQRHRLLGNRLADTAADLGQEFHPPLDSEMLKVDNMAFKAAQAVVALAAKILPLHPKRSKHLRQEAPDVIQVPPDVPLLQAATHSPSPPTQATGEGLPGVPASSGEPMARMSSLAGSERVEQSPEQADRAERGPAHHAWVALKGNPGTWKCTCCGQVANTGHPTPPSPVGV